MHIWKNAFSVIQCVTGFKRNERQKYKDLPFHCSLCLILSILASQDSASSLTLCHPALIALSRRISSSSRTDQNRMPDLGRPQGFHPQFLLRYSLFQKCLFPMKESHKVTREDHGKKAKKSLIIKILPKTWRPPKICISRFNDQKILQRFEKHIYRETLIIIELILYLCFLMFFFFLKPLVLLFP